MVYAVISDVHGNRWALEAILHDISARPVDVLVNLGDSVYGPLQPHETALLLRECCQIHVLGNQDRILLEPSGHGRSPAIEACTKTLTDADLAWLQESHKSSIALDDLLLVHGTALNDSEYLTEDISSGVPAILSAASIEERIGSSDAKVVLCGHSHMPRCIRTRDRLVVNPGSVGLQAYDDEAPVPHFMETGSPDARYAILELDGEQVTVHHIAVPYDYHEAMALAARNGRTDWAYWLERGRAKIG